MSRLYAGTFRGFDSILLAVASAAGMAVVALVALLALVSLVAVLLVAAILGLVLAVAAAVLVALHVLADPADRLLGVELVAFLLAELVHELLAGHALVAALAPFLPDPCL